MHDPRPAAAGPGRGHGRLEVEVVIQRNLFDKALRLSDV